MKVLGSLWRIYLFIIFSSTVALIVIDLFQWHTIKQDADTELRYLNDVSFTSTRVMLDQQKSLFERLSEKLQTLDLANDSDRLRVIIDQMIKNNPEIAAFIVRDPEGKLVLTNSEAADTRGLPTLLSDPLTQYNFQRTLTQNKLVIGSNRFISLLNKQVIAVHFAVRKNGKVIAVLTSAIEHTIDRYAWNNSQLTHGSILQVFRDDYLFIYSSRPQGTSKNHLFTRFLR